MKKIILSSVIATACLSLFAVDFGGALGNFSKFANQNSEDGIKLNQRNSASLYVRVPFGQTDNYFFTQGSYQFERDFGADTKINSVNLDTALAVFNEGPLSINIGRFSSSDITEKIYNQAGDGAKLTYSLPGFYSSASLIYTGLLNSQSVTIIDPDYNADTDKLYDLNARYFISTLRADLLNFWKEQTISAELIYAIRLEGNSYSKIYTSGKIEGPLPISGVYYDAVASIEFSKYDSFENQIDYLTGANLYYYPGLKNSQITLSCIYASGADTKSTDGKVGFFGITSMTSVNSLEENEYNSIFLAGLNASIKPVSSLLLSAGGDAVFSTLDNKFEYEGFQCNANIDYQIVSDVYTGLEFTQYIGKENSDIDKTSITVKAVISF